MEFFETFEKTAYKVQEEFKLLRKDIFKIADKDKNETAEKVNLLN